MKPSGAANAAPLTPWMRDLLVELCAVDTSPRADVARMRLAEDAAFAILERELSRLPFPGAILERRPINPAIAEHPFYSPLHQTKTADNPNGLGPAEAYAGRANLLYRIPGAGSGTALNAHIDVIAPYFPPKAEDGIVHGRGSCDDKGGVVAIVAALRLMAERGVATGAWPTRPITAMFVIEEEPGGNGSLSLAIDRGLKAGYEELIVLECTNNRIHPANRGAVWYRAVLSGDVPLLEAAAFVIGELEDEGRAIKAESRHALFPQRPVQTCHGMLGPYGEHPSRICGEAAFRIRCARPPAAAMAALVRDCLEAGLAEYVGRYGDKTQVLDRVTGRPKVARHYDLIAESTGFLVVVHGAPGHMGSVNENDGAITKLAALVRALVRSKPALSRIMGSEVTIGLAEAAPGPLGLEGGQGFVPTHSMEEVTARLRSAAARGLAGYLAHSGRPNAASIQVSYDKLHNAAFDGDPDSPAMRRALAAAARCGRPQPEVVGWTVSCDARLFALEYPGMPVLTVGPGLVEHAHSDQEQVRLEDVVWAASWIATYLLDS